MRLSLFFPAYNEESNIAASVARAEAVLSGLVLSGTIRDYEIIVVDDGSEDRTGAIADNLALSNARVRAVHHGSNRGYGMALLSGIAAARNEWVFFSDADLQFDLYEISKLIAYAREYGVIIGYRAPRRDPFMRLANAFGWNMLCRVLFGLSVKDIDCAFKLFERRLVADLPVRSGGAMVSAEILIRLQRQGIAFKQVPVKHLPRVRGSPTGASPKVVIRAFRELISVYRSDLGKTDTAYVQGAKFGMVGVANTLVDVAAYFWLTRFTPFFDTHILAAKFVTFFFGTVCSFLLNRYFTFGLRTRVGVAEIARFYSTAVLTVTVNVGSLYVFNGLLGIYDLVAVGLSTIATFVIGFTFTRMWVFKKTARRPVEPVRLSKSSWKIIP